MDPIQSNFRNLLLEHQIELSAEQLNQFEIYFQELVEWNEKMNLTGITEREQVYIKHFYDSATLSFYLDMSEIATLADIGSGAGFPGIPLKICFPHLKLTIVDSINKRILFLQNVVDKLGLKDVKLIHGRAEDVARKEQERDAYDLVTARAVARMAVLNEFCLPFVKTGGIFAAMKGSDPNEEIMESARSMSELKGKLVGKHHFNLPLENSERHIVIVKKTFATPKKYPRKAGTPMKSPII
ncbi:16S rRNA (guanine(527)-N(7))-methyltransferase RsmG [Paenibacillus anaericanus]|uniref:Ribosomal RNA small subunit methyltransferase G n=1 Tax=Paenibacillus anaericanus TaxID=170367 RepID=A0A3S1BTH5_9BACL|nr:16S rRNA (guanine(527)-N(7))-methyltransferase RsmG [Paenibacillus anaericanus]RUT47084.1 16S rRNA (guanine(527)-N(7))-methyltransferase RsmG [Paenibacillus anaericanus]